MAKTLIRIGALAVPWLLTVVVPILLLPRYIVSSGGEIDFATAKAVLARLDGWSLSVQLHKILGFR